jgi:hypothetical protein
MAISSVLQMLVHQRDPFEVREGLATFFWPKRLKR